MALSCISSEISPILVENRDFFIPPCIQHPVWYGKTRMVGLPDGEKNFEDMYNRPFRLNTGVCRTDGQTSCYGIVRAIAAMRTRRVVKTNRKSHIAFDWY